MGKDSCPDGKSDGTGHTGQGDCSYSWGSQRDYHPSDCNCRYCEKSACFPYNTLVDTPGGKVKIGDLKKGQMILSYVDGKLVPRLVTRKWNRGIAEVVRVEFGAGNSLSTTMHHTFLTSSGWKKMANIKAGDKMVQVDGSSLVVKSITRQKAEPVFNIYTAGEHNFIAEGFVAHNFTEFRVLRTILHRIFLDPIASPEMALA